jgi:hypothetical protein
VFAATQPYTFAPAGALDLKNSSPAVQVAGKVVPVFIGLVELAAEKSTLLLCVRKSMVVCATRPEPRYASPLNNTISRILHRFTEPSSSRHNGPKIKKAALRGSVSVFQRGSKFHQVVFCKLLKRKEK